MIGRPIGFYVHHEGRGHLDRTRAIIAALGDRPTVVATSRADAPGLLPSSEVTVLDGDVPAGPLGDVTANGAFHWAPADSRAGQARARQLLGWVQRHQPALVVVDVSVEVAVFLRLLGVAVVAVRLPGTRDDDTHRLGYRVAAGLLAPFAAAMEDPATPPAVVAATTHCGLVTRHAVSAAPPGAAPTPPARATGRPRALVVWGQGTEPPSGPQLDAAARATPGWEWTVVGPPCPERAPALVTHLGWREDLRALVESAAVVIGAPGDGTLGLVAATSSCFVAIVQARPFGEQAATAAQLDRHGVAVVEASWPEPRRWPMLLERACTLDPTRLQVLGASGAARRAARWLANLAAEQERTVEHG